jgi:hypothetical protein
MNSPEFQLGEYEFVILERRTMWQSIEIEKKSCAEIKEIMFEILKSVFLAE